jgi:hypothetical protein
VRCRISREGEKPGKETCQGNQARPRQQLEGDTVLATTILGSGAARDEQIASMERDTSLKLIPRVSSQPYRGKKF